MDTYKNHHVYRKVLLKECLENTVQWPIRVRWVIVNKGAEENPEYRARLGAKQIKLDQWLDLFAAMLALEAKKFLLSLAVFRRAERGKPHKVSFIDTKRVYFHAKAIKDVCVDLPSQDHKKGCAES